MSAGFPWTAPPAVQRCLLTPERIVFTEQLDTVEAVFERIGRAVEARATPGAGEIAARLLKRHARRSTALGHGVALPHAEVRGLRAPVAVFIRSRHGIDFRAHDGDPVFDVLALLVPRPATAAHAELLAELTARLTTPVFREQLARCNSAKAILNLFAEAAPRVGAPTPGPLLTRPLHGH
jgi:nitrogen PTS system EIIA component